jgi:hypothetical protein
LISIVSSGDKRAESCEDMFGRFAERPDNTDEARVFASDKEIVIAFGVSTSVSLVRSEERSGESVFFWITTS